MTFITVRLQLLNSQSMGETSARKHYAPLTVYSSLQVFFLPLNVDDVDWTGLTELRLIHCFNPKVLLALLVRKCDKANKPEPVLSFDSSSCGRAVIIKSYVLHHCTTTFFLPGGTR